MRIDSEFETVMFKEELNVTVWKFPDKVYINIALWTHTDTHTSNDAWVYVPQVPNQGGGNSGECCPENLPVNHHIPLRTNPRGQMQTMSSQLLACSVYKDRGSWEELWVNLQPLKRQHHHSNGRDDLASASEGCYMTPFLPFF